LLGVAAGEPAVEQVGEAGVGEEDEREGEIAV